MSELGSLAPSGMFNSGSVKLSFLVPAMACLGLVGVSCTSNCGVSDAVTILDEREGNYLVYRVSGAQDKIEFFEVYKTRPEFDSCGSAKTPVVAKEAYLPSQGLLKKVEWRQNRLLIVYTQNASESIRPDKARLSP
jgi:hypothetical protein